MLRPIKDCNSQDANPSDLDSHIIFRVPGKDLAWQFPVAVLWVPGGDAGAGDRVAVNQSYQTLKMDGFRLDDWILYRRFLELSWIF